MLSENNCIDPIKNTDLIKIKKPYQTKTYK